MTGFPDAAVRTVGSAVELARKTRHHLSLNNALSYACPIFYWGGHYEECARYVEMLDGHVARHGLVARRPVATLYRAAMAYTQNGASSEVVHDLELAVEEFRKTNHLARMPYYLSVMADALNNRGRLADAETTIRTALNIAHAQNEGWCLPEVLRVQASILTVKDQVNEAEALLVESMALAQKIGALSWRLRAASDLAQLWCAQSRASDARQLLLPIYSQFTEGFETRDLVIAADILASVQDPKMA